MSNEKIKFNSDQILLIKKFSKCFCCGQYAALDKGDIDLILSGYKELKISCSDKDCQEGYAEYMCDLDNDL